jgi:hypothetical protein
MTQRIIYSNTGRIYIVRKSNEEKQEERKGTKKDLT